MTTTLRIQGLIGVLVLLLVAACTGSPSGPQRPSGAIDIALQAVIAGLGAGDLSKAPVDDPARATADLTVILQGMDDFRPTVTAGDPREVGTATQVTLQVRWALGGVDWTYDTIATFIPGGDNTWVLQWDPRVVHPELTSLNRLVHKRVAATRGSIIGGDGVALAELLPVVRLGIDKSRMDAKQAVASAGRLASVLKINKSAYVERVQRAGKQAFVEALVLRGRGESVPEAFYDIPGALMVRDELVLPTRKGRAADLIGTVGDATAERVKESGGAILPGERVGLSGLQLRHDDQLRGVAGSTVSLADRPGGTSPSPSTPSPGTASPSAEAAPEPLFTAAPVPGKDLTISINASLQDKAEQAISSRKSATAMAVVQPSTGAVVALATNAAGDGQQLANLGRYAPGSTFKIATALALLRSGMTAGSSLPCTEFITVDGRRFKNYSDFPQSRLGQMSLADAIATSCNTAFISQHERLSGARLREAAISLGMGADHEAGFPAFYGSVPDPVDTVGLAAAEIGQGTVEASPMAMAGMAASVAAGRTVVPWLIPSNRPTQSGTPLSAGEARQLQEMMRATVLSGTGQSLRGVAAGAKTGTAEYGTDNPPRTHAWMIAWTEDDLAVAVLVTEGESGSGDAAPLIKKLLS